MQRPFYTSFAKTLAILACLVLAALQSAACSSREQRAQSYYESGMSYIEKKDYAKARIELRNALQLREDMVDAWRALAKIDEHDRNVQSLLASLKRIAELDDKDVATRAQLGRLYLAGGAVQEALKVTNAAEELDPQNASVLALKAAVLFRLRDDGGAIRTANRALQIDPGNTDATVILAAEQFKQADFDGALKILASITDAHQNDLGVLLLKVNIFNRKGDLAQVESLLRQLIALHPDQPGFRRELVKFYITQKRPQDAEKELRAAIAANPNDANAEIELVNFLASQSGLPAARAELVTRINAGGQIFPFQIALAKLDFAQGNVAESTKLLEDLIKTPTPSDAIAARTTLAQMYLARNNVAAAEPLLSDILAADSRNIEALRLRAAIRVDRNQFDDAIADLRRALNDQPNSPALLASLGLAYERGGSIELADKSFADAMRASNFAPALGLNYVAFLERRGLSEQAESVLVQLASRNPNNPSVLSALARIKLARQDWVGAHQAADAIQNISGKNNVTDQIHGAAFSGQNKFSDSVAVLQDAYSANPNAVQPLAALVDAYLKAQQPDNAQAFLESVLKANPANAEALVLMGSVQLIKNNPTQAQKYFETAIKQQPTNASGYSALANLYMRQNKADDALKIIRAGLEQQSKNFALRLSLAGILELKKDYDGAIAEYDSLLKDQPGSMIIANNLASLLTDHRSDTASLDRAKTLVLLLKNSQVPQFKDTLGWVAYQQKDYDAAIAYLEDAAAKMPNVALVRYHLGMSYLAAGQNAKATEEFTKARSLAPNDADLNLKIDAALKNRSEKEKG